MKKTKIKNTVEYYLNLPYEFIIIPEESGGFSIKVKEFEYCSGFGETLEEAWESVKGSMRIWIEDVLEKGMEIPLPESMKEYSGKFVVRLPKYLHRKLSKLAEKEGVSLNQLVVSSLSEKVGMKEVENKILNKFDELIKLASESLALNKIRLEEPQTWYRERFKIYKNIELLTSKEKKRKRKTSYEVS